jgi:kynurenine formamidase
MNKVKDRMLSRRDVFRGTAAAAAGLAGAAALASVPGAAQAAGHGGGLIDMTHELHEGFPTFLGPPGLSYDKRFDFGSDGFNLYVLSVDEHVGTHIDAPLHFSADGASVAELPVESLMCPLAVIDIAARASEDPDTQVTPDDLKAWMAAHGPIPDGACVAMHSGWAGRVGDAAAFRNPDAEGVMHFPGFHIEATQMLLEETSAVALAVDTLSTDFGASADFATHYAWLPAGRYNIECLAGLDALPAAGATLIVGAPKHRGGTGGPARIFAMV